MKVFLIISLSVFSAFVWADKVTCPEGTNEILSCQSTPQAGDSEVVSGAFDFITVCRGTTQAALIVEKSAQAEVAEASVEDRMGGATYLVKADDVDFSLSTVSGVRPGLATKATLSVTFNGAQGLTASSTYTCNHL